MKRTLLSLFVVTPLLSWSQNIFPANGNVGIGTTSPAQILHVHKVDWAGMRVTTDATGSTINDGVNFGYDNNYGAYIWNRENTPIIFSTNNLERARFGSNGNFGIGITNPSHVLDVNGVSRFRQRFQVTGNSSPTTGAGVEMGYSNPNGLLISYDRDAVAFRSMRYIATDHKFEIDGNEKVRIGSNGYVGIGTTNPAQILDVNGVGRFRQRLQITGTDYPTTGAGVEIGYHGTAGVIVPIDRDAGVLKPMRYNSAEHKFEIDNVEKVTINAVGNLGVWTSAPVYPLDVNGVSRMRERLQVTGNLSPTNGVGVEIGYTGSSGVILSYDRDASLLKSMRYNAGDHKFEINSIEKLVVTGAGNVGIGKNNPAYPLDVSGSVNATSFLINGVPVGPGTTPWTSSGANISYTNGNIGVGEAAQPNTRFSLRASGTTTNTAFRIVDNTSTEKFKILDNGTTTVTGPVTVSSGVLTLANVGSVATFQQMSPYSNNTESIITIPTGATDQGVVFKGLNQINGAVYDAVTIGALNYSFSSGSGGKFRALSISPTLNLTGTYSGTVVGLEYNPSTTALFGTTHIAADFKKGQLRLGEIANDDALTQVIVREPTTGELRYRSASSIGGASLWSSSGSSAFYDTGNVGIGISNPQNKLDVNGTVHAKEVKVDLTGWPDYVFDKDYKLTPLSDLKEYLSANKHLPGVPTAKEVKENGLMLGEMNKVLLQKIEELTMHLIELSDLVQSQQEEIVKLKKKP